MIKDIVIIVITIHLYKIIKQLNSFFIEQIERHKNLPKGKSV